MQSVLRSSLSAVVVAAGAALMALPAAAQYVVPGSVHPWGGMPVIDSYVVHVQGPEVEAGEYVRFRMTGTPGARVVINVPNLADSGFVLPEVAPGVYELVHWVRPDQSPHGFTQALGIMQSAGKQAMRQTPDVQQTASVYGAPAYGAPAYNAPAPSWGRRWDGRPWTGVVR
jgi:hypothetical protein